MGKNKRAISFAVCIVLLFSLIGVGAFAESQSANLAVGISSSKIEVGDTITAIITNSDMTVSSIAGGIEFDPSMLECVSITQDSSDVSVISTVDEASANGTIGFAIVGFQDKAYASGSIASATFRATKTGTTTISLYEDSAGENGYKGDGLTPQSVEISEKTEKHTLVKVNKKDATCTEAGYKEYWKCSDCNKLFSDAEGKNEIQQPEIVPALGHNLNKLEAAAATCEQDGNIECYICSQCNKYFSDAEGKHEIPESEAIIDALGHDWGEWVVKKEATETEDGEQERTCKNDASHTESVAIPAKGSSKVVLIPEVSVGGTVEPKTVTCEIGASKKFTAIPNTGYELKEVIVDGKNIGAKKEFEVKNIKKTTTVKVVFEKKSVEPAPSPSEEPDPTPSEPVTSFKDVKKGSWYYEGVLYVESKGYMTGIGNNRFNPAGKMTRAMITEILYAMEGKPSITKNAGFKDIAAGKWYTDAVNWCAAKGIVAGYTNGKFGPNDTITRQQLAAILYKYSKYKKYDISANGSLSKFKDASSVTSYAVTPMKWAIGHKLLAGTDKGLEPKGTATRAQVAVILKAFDESIKK